MSEGTFVETIKVWQWEWFYITEPRTENQGEAPAFTAEPLKRLVSWQGGLGRARVRGGEAGVEGVEEGGCPAAAATVHGPLERGGGGGHGEAGEVVAGTDEVAHRPPLGHRAGAAAAAPHREVAWRGGSRGEEREGAGRRARYCCRKRWL